MADGIETTGGAVVPVSDKPVVEKPLAPEVKTPPAEKPADKPGVAKAKPQTEVVETKVKRARVEEDDDLPDEAEMLEMTPRAFKVRLTRQSNKELDELFGHHDRAKIAADQKELVELRDGKEKDRKAKLDEVTRLKEEKQEAERKALAAEERAEAVETEREVDRTIETFRELEDGVVDKGSAKFVRGEYKEHLLELAESDPAELEKLDKSPKALKAHFKKWLGDFLKENPKHAAGADAAPKKGLNSGATPDDQEPGDKAQPRPGEVGGKTFRPGQANSMTSAEARAAAMAKYGVVL